MLIIQTTSCVDFQNPGNTFSLPQASLHLPVFQPLHAGLNALNVDFDWDFVPDDVRCAHSRPKLFHIRIHRVEDLQGHNDMRQCLPSVLFHIPEQIQARIHLPKFGFVPSKPRPEFREDVLLRRRQLLVIAMGYLVKNHQVFLETHEVAHGDLGLITKTDHVAGDIIHRHEERLDHRLICWVGVRKVKRYETGHE